ncbi:hypothetical protein JCGZ_14844 [Jatropha curcas]|uniref:Knottin scorpion toxin-like domain-containing protein n=1 Tax=Jatropha curcas TaxID=180498 RepID=A0A067JP11_JATCU|nr:hypothetical protein JCGZ_03734 [Jatropha curcas]KDP31619.1 hypothetical protein JCGZ_14844 [Jatropha curcas]
MAQVKVLCCVLIVALTVCGDLNEVADAGICCAEHYELGSCIPGIDDNPEKNGKCWVFCVADCTRGGVCKQTSGNNHHCHCYC